MSGAPGTGSKGTKKEGDLSVTALYTAGAWSWGALPGADLLASDPSRTVFRVTNAALGVSRLFNWRQRSLRHGLLHRHTMIDHLLRASGAKRVVELAAGLSRRGVAFSEDPAVRYTEVDLAPMLEHKRALLGRTDAGRAALERPNLRLVAGDVLEMDLAGLAEGDGPSFVIAEGLLVYLTPPQQRALFAKVRGAIAAGGAGGAFVFDLLPSSEEPPPGAIGRALGWMMKRFTGGKTFERDARSRDDIAAELREAGFDEVERFEPAAVAAEWGLPHPDVPTAQLVFAARCRPSQP